MQNILKLPGDKLPSSAFTGGSIKLGPGLQQSRGNNQNESLLVTAISPGVLKHTTKGNKWWIDRRASRVNWSNLCDGIELTKSQYSPAAQESVIGYITH